MTTSKQPVALVTGASRGAGAGIARALGSYGLRVYVTGTSRSGGRGQGVGWRCTTRHHS
jgi:NAD(P)-dependent dehydrogenase (short-subunit alcohol dehydrogenase family)